MTMLAVTFSIVAQQLLLSAPPVHSYDVCQDVLDCDMSDGTVLLQLNMRYVSPIQQEQVSEPSDTAQLATDDMLGERNATALIAEVTAIQEKHDLVLFTRKVTHPYLRRESVFYQIHRSARDGVPSVQVQFPYFGLSVVAWTVSLVVVGITIFFYCYRKRVDLPEEDSYLAERGRQSWLYLAFILTTCFSLAVFMLTMVLLAMINSQIQQKPEDVENIDGQDATATRHIMGIIGVRCIEASQGITLSVAIAAITLFNWRFADKVQISAALLVQFAIRGATLSILITSITELGGLYLMHTAGTPAQGYTYYFGNLLDCLVVGFSEESAKLAALVSCTYLSTRTLINVPPGCWPRSCLCRVLCESPRAFALAGMAVGYGFMILENGGYMASIVATPVTTYETAGSPADSQQTLAIETAMSQVIALFEIASRIFLNIHPWLVGISAARVASVVWTNEPDMRLLGFVGFVWALAPSALAHCLFDFLVITGPTIVKLITPIVFFWAARSILHDKWIEFPPDAVIKSKGVFIDFGVGDY